MSKTLVVIVAVLAVLVGYQMAQPRGGSALKPRSTKSAPGSKLGFEPGLLRLGRHRRERNGSKLA